MSQRFAKLTAIVVLIALTTIFVVPWVMDEFGRVHKFWPHKF